MRRLACLALSLALVGCGGGGSSGTLSVTCNGGAGLAGAASIDVLGDTTNGRPILNFPDPANPGMIGTIAVPAHERCKITPAVAN
ncbi:MAG TPA: hypothetical protein VMQ99_20665 [Acetobacteraceae bacterium]|jgi:hypothetical protein|nr:hypothetical protein [Acetobacteraceae bacterium]